MVSENTSILAFVNSLHVFYFLSASVDGPALRRGVGILPFAHIRQAMHMLRWKLLLARLVSTCERESTLC